MKQATDQQHERFLEQFTLLQQTLKDSFVKKGVIETLYTQMQDEESREKLKNENLASRLEKNENNLRLTLAKIENLAEKGESSKKTEFLYAAFDEMKSTIEKNSLEINNFRKIEPSIQRILKTQEETLEECKRELEANSKNCFKITEDFDKYQRNSVALKSKEIENMNNLEVSLHKEMKSLLKSIQELTSRSEALPKNFLKLGENVEQIKLRVDSLEDGKEDEKVLPLLNKITNGLKKMDGLELIIGNLRKENENTRRKLEDFQGENHKMNEKTDNNMKELQKILDIQSSDLDKLQLGLQTKATIENEEKLGSLIEINIQEISRTIQNCLERMNGMEKNLRISEERCHSEIGLALKNIKNNDIHLVEIETKLEQQIGEIQSARSIVGPPPHHTLGRPAKYHSKEEYNAKYRENYAKKKAKWANNASDNSSKKDPNNKDLDNLKEPNIANAERNMSQETAEDQEHNCLMEGCTPCMNHDTDIELIKEDLQKLNQRTLVDFDQRIVDCLKKITSFETAVHNESGKESTNDIKLLRIDVQKIKEELPILFKRSKKIEEFDQKFTVLNINNQSTKPIQIDPKIMDELITKITKESERKIEGEMKKINNMEYKWETGNNVKNLNIKNHSQKKRYLLNPPITTRK